MRFRHGKYILGLFLGLPLLPVMYWQAQRIMRTMPKLPEATGNSGVVSNGNSAKTNLLFIGESTIAGVGVQEHRDGFAGYLAREIAKNLEVDVRWKVYAKSGYTIQQVLKKILPLIQEKKPDLIVVGLGANDAFKLNYPIRWNRQIRAFIGKLRDKFPSTPIAFISVPPLKEFPSFTYILRLTIGNLGELLSQELKLIVRDYPQVYYRGHNLTVKEWSDRFDLANEPAIFFSDGVHPSKLTYQLWAQDFAQYLLKNDCIKVERGANPTTKT